MRNVRCCHFSTASTVSRVVPGMSLTIDRSSFSNRFSSDDLPTFGRPTIATGGLRRFVRRVAGARGRAGKPRDDLVQQVADALAVLGGDLDDRLEAELVELDGRVRAPAVVGLVDRHQDRRLRRLAAPRRSPRRPRPALRAHRRRTQSPRSRWPAGRADDQLVQRIVAGAEHPAGIDQRERRPLPLGRLRNESRVVPATGVTMARRVSVIRLNRVDLPTLGRPTSTTVGPARTRFRGMSKCVVRTEA